MIDNDAFILLGGCGLLEPAVSLLGFAHADCFRLAALPYMLGGKHIRNHYPPDNVTRARIECDRFTALNEETGNAAVLDALSVVRGIHEGEEVLFAIAADDSSCFVLTGDKVSLEALGTTPAIKHVRDALAGRIICLERALRMLVEARGASAVAQELLSVQPVHASLRIFFSAGNRNDDAKCLMAIDAYHLDLATRVGSDLLLA